MHKPSTSPTVLDLFCGAGGLSYGFEQAGYNVVAGVDFFKQAVDTFRRNHKGSQGLVADLTKASIKEIEKASGNSVEVIVGGPSCQGFSTAGGLSKGVGRDQTDPRNALFNEYVRIVDHFRPSWLVFENVPGLLLYRRGEVALSIISALRDVGYRVVPMILLAADYGVPQLRRRIVFIGNRVGRDILFPAPTHGDSGLWRDYSLPFAHLSRLSTSTSSRLPHVTFKEACGDLPSLREGQALNDSPYTKDAASDYQKVMRANSSQITQHVCDELSELDRYAAQNLKPGENWLALKDHGVLPPRFSKIRSYDATTMLKRLEMGKPAYTITTKFNEATTGAFIHPTQARTLSIREAARLQSFPDCFRFDGSFGHIRKQIGNAVPPLLAKAIAQAMLPGVLGNGKPIIETIAIANGITDEEILHLKSAGKDTKMHSRKKRGINLLSGEKTLAAVG